ncbi:MAG: 2-oxoacid:acceptor oxidoreductase family protein [Eubacteriales bacterium]|nr:2-oxoacid:acceptor oxidoreductase family protein [Eubacteriales bacterium]
MLEQTLFAGFGGQGMLLIGEFLAEAGMEEGKYVSWLPSYGPEMRGGTANCSVVVSDRPISSPVITAASCVIAMNRPSLDKFENTVRPGGLLIVNSSLIDVKAKRDDIDVLYIPASEVAEEIGNPKGANVVILGAYLARRPVVSVDSLMSAMKVKLGERKARFLEGNKKALLAGLELGKVQ